MTLTAVQQHLLNYFNLVKVASLKSTIEIYEEALRKTSVDGECRVDSISEKLAKELSEINVALQQFDLEIVECMDEITGEKLNVLINTSDNTLTRKFKFYDENTTQFFSKIVNECMLSEEGNVSETVCLNLNLDAKMTKSTAQTILEKLIKDKWLSLTNNKISLGMRSIAELEQNIKQHYPEDVKNCPFCKLFIMQGYICSNCKIRSHYTCWKKYYTVTKAKCVCPNCKEVWHDVPADVKVEDSFQVEEAETSVSLPPKRKKKKCVS